VDSGFIENLALLFDCFYFVKLFKCKKAFHLDERPFSLLAIETTTVNQQIAPVLPDFDEISKLYQLKYNILPVCFQF
jgi:hypothetical protein